MHFNTIVFNVLMVYSIKRSPFGVTEINARFSEDNIILLLILITQNHFPLSTKKHLPTGVVVNGQII